MDAYANLKTIIEEVALARLKTVSAREDLHIETCPDNLLQHALNDECIAIRVFNRSSFVALTVYFDSLAMDAFMAMNKNVCHLVADRAIRLDFIKEYCNLLAGGIRQTFDNICLKTADSEEFRQSILDSHDADQSHGQAPLQKNEADAVTAERQHSWLIRADKSSLIVSLRSTALDGLMLQLMAETNIDKTLVTDNGSIEIFFDQPTNDAAVFKICMNCKQEFKSEEDILKYGSRWRVALNYLWVNCKCNSTLAIPLGKYQWFSPENVLRPEARTVFNTLCDLKSLPNLPIAVLEFQQLLDESKVSPQMLAKAAKKEPLIAASIINLANTSKFNKLGLLNISLEQAIAALDREKLSDIITMSSVKSFPSKCKIFDIEKFWTRAVLTGSIAEHLVDEFAHHLSPDEAYLAGCLCNIGKIVMSLCFPYTTDIIAADENDPAIIQPWLAGEAKHGLPNHCILGEIGASFWGMPSFVVEAVRSHHTMPLPGNRSTLSLDEITSFANQLTHLVSRETNQVDRSLLVALGKKFEFSDEQQIEAYVEKTQFIARYAT